MAINKLAALLCLFVAASAMSREAASPAACAAAADSPSVAGARATLDADGTDLAARLRLADAWGDAGCFGEALQVLQQGEAAHPRDKELQARLQVAKSLVSEQTYFDSLDRAAKDAKSSRALFRCSKLAEVSSCDEGLSLRPDDPELLTAKADTLVQLKRPAEALRVYRSAQQVATNKDALASKIAAAESQRRALVDACETRVGENARLACDAAWLPGAADEEAVLTRRGLLLQSDNQLSPALDSYMAAARIKPTNSSVAQAIVSLSDSTGRKDALTMDSRGVALMTLGRPAEAIDALREALRLAPDLADARNELRLAERANTRKPERMTVRVAQAILTPPRTAGNPSDSPVRQFSNAAEATRTN